MISKFLLAENPTKEDGKEYILHTESPRFLVEITESNLGYKFSFIQEYDELDKEQKEKLYLEMLDWWNEYLDWEDKLVE